MKPTREEILKLADGFFCDRAIEEDGDDITDFALAMYKRGAEDMRERAIDFYTRYSDPIVIPTTTSARAALPIGDE